MTEVIFISETLPRLLTDTIFNELTVYAIFLYKLSLHALSCGHRALSALQL